MLIPAQLVESELAKAWRDACLADLDRMRWYRMGAGVDWAPSPHANGDWSRIARASVVMVDGQPKVLGYCSAGIDRDCMVVTNLAAWSAQPGSMTYLRDLHRFCDQLMDQARLIRFTVALDNPARKGWAKWVKANGGTQLCVLECYGRGVTGELLDVAQYQVPGRLVR